MEAEDRRAGAGLDDGQAGATRVDAVKAQSPGRVSPLVAARNPTPRCILRRIDSRPER